MEVKIFSENMYDCDIMVYAVASNDIICVHVWLSFWKESQTELLRSLQGKSLIVSGDGRCDSPGFLAISTVRTLLWTLNRSLYSTQRH